MKLEHKHTPAAIAKRLGRGPSVNYLRDWVYGGIDGAVTTFAIVAGVIGAELSASIVLILGLVNLLADGFSMAAANYSGTKTEEDDYKRLHAMEERHIAREPEGEREEIRQIFHAKGYQGKDLETLVTLIASQRQIWIETMLSEEFGLATTLRSPVKAAVSTFVVFGSVPLLPFLFAGRTGSAELSLAMTAVVFFATGSMKAHWPTQYWVWSGLETLSIDLGAAGIAWAHRCGAERNCGLKDYAATFKASAHRPRPAHHRTTRAPSHRSEPHADRAVRPDP
ncbi:VIT1/CCC1 transporter family protein [Breoghania sp.]|uniref:VIT1/CCC1 transporter family protein n=1 Tax=Breoghania sp. TaxID=2065378 RepID=UPI002612C74A|nr:VIT1/CCC1 transporter family protein [Breoghania sp.]MDJ0932707.1 VIT1/CCC1 transporter family protein [Breoghania sp.]